MVFADYIFSPFSLQIAKKFVDAALNYGKDMAIGRGRHGPFDHLLKLKVCRSVAPRAFSPSDLFLYAVTDSGMNEKWGRSITEAVKAAIEGGATIVQLRYVFYILCIHFILFAS